MRQGTRSMKSCLRQTNHDLLSGRVRQKRNGNKNSTRENRKGGSYMEMPLSEHGNATAESKRNQCEEPASF